MTNFIDTQIAMSLGMSPLTSAGSLSHKFARYAGYYATIESIKKEHQKLVSLIPTQYVGNKSYFGVEIEVENICPKIMFMEQTPLPPGWFTHSDGSLRNGIEYVSDPLCVSDLFLALA